MPVKTAPKIKHTEIPDAIEGRQAFTAGKLRASVSPEGIYTLWSYHAPIAGHTPGGVWWVAAGAVTPTTREHIRTVRAALALHGLEAVIVHV